MIGSTCERCWEGRHIRCQAKGTCACSLCGVDVAKPLRQKLKPRPKRRSGGIHPTVAAQPVGHLKGRHALAGYSTLPPETQARIAELLLDETQTISSIARTVGCTRDQVRTIRNRAAGVTHRETRTA